MVISSSWLVPIMSNGVPIGNHVSMSGITVGDCPISASINEKASDYRVGGLFYLPVSIIYFLMRLVPLIL